MPLQEVVSGDTMYGVFQVKVNDRIVHEAVNRISSSKELAFTIDTSGWTMTHGLYILRCGANIFVREGKQYLGHGTSRLPGKVENTEFGVVFAFDEPTVLWDSDKYVFYVDTYVVLEDYSGSKVR